MRRYRLAAFTLMVSMLTQTCIQSAESPAPLKEIRIGTLSKGVGSSTPASVNEDVQEVARRELFRLRWSQGPELVHTRQISLSVQERREIDSVGFRTPLADRWAMTVLGIYERDRLDAVDGNDVSTHITTLHLRIETLLGRYGRGWIGVVPYGGSDGESVGVETGASWYTDSGFAFGVEGSYNLPWAENTIAVAEDGRQHTIAFNLRLPLSKRWTLTGTATANWYRVGPEATGAARSAGFEHEQSAQLEYALLRNRDRIMGAGFMAPTLEYEETIDSHLILYCGAVNTEFDRREGFNLVPVTDKSAVFRAGFDFSHALSRHWGITAGAFVGRDPAREIAWNKYYGMQTRIIFVPKARFRFHAGYETTSESANGLGAGQTDVYSMGWNINF